MPLELRWKTSLSATCLHAAACQRSGLEAADASLAAVLSEPAAALAREIADCGWPIDSVLHQLAALASEYENNRELVTRALARLRLPAPAASGAAARVAGAVADLEAAMLRSQPQLVEELAVRTEPLREQWEARGPGLLREVGRLTDEMVIHECAEVVLVAPYAGGHGVAYPAQNRVTLEAMLFHPHPELPEIVRLAWLLCQLNSDLPRFADALPGGRAARAFQLAMIPPVLAGAEAVEVAKCDLAGIAAALDFWRLGPALPADAAERLWSWWNTWLDRPGSWAVAVAALDRMLA